MSCRQLTTDQESDQEVNQLAQFAVNEDEASHQAQCFYHKSGVLMRKWRPRDTPANEEWQVTHQIVLSRKYNRDILSLALRVTGQCTSSDIPSKLSNTFVSSALCSVEC